MGIKILFSQIMRTIKFGSQRIIYWIDLFQENKVYITRIPPVWPSKKELRKIIVAFLHWVIKLSYLEWGTILYGNMLYPFPPTLHHVMPHHTNLIPRQVMLPCHAMPLNAMEHYAMPHYVVMSCHTMQHHATLHRATSCHAMSIPCNIMPHHVMHCYAMHVMPLHFH